MALDDGDVEGESMQARIERLGRERPAKFKTAWTEIGFCFSLLASIVMAVSNFFPLKRKRLTLNFAS